MVGVAVAVVVGVAVVVVVAVWVGVAVVVVVAVWVGVVVAVWVGVVVAVGVVVGVGEYSFMNTARILELLDEREYPITGDSPLARYALELRDAIAALREEVSRLTENQRQQDSATAFVMERDEKERDALRKEVEEYKSEYFRVHNLKMDAIEARLAAERELAACKENELSTVSKLERERDALREEVSRLTENQRQQDSATAFVMERDEKERDALRREVEELKPFKDAIDDQMIILHLGTADTYPAKQCLDEIINWQVSISLDPQVSSDAAALRDTHLERAEAAERELAACREERDIWFDYIDPFDMYPEHHDLWHTRKAEIDARGAK